MLTPIHFTCFLGHSKTMSVSIVLDTQALADRLRSRAGLLFGRKEAPRMADALVRSNTNDIVVLTTTTNHQHPQHGIVIERDPKLANVHYLLGHFDWTTRKPSRKDFYHMIDAYFRLYVDHSQDIVNHRLWARPLTNYSHNWTIGPDVGWFGYRFATRQSISDWTTKYSKDNESMLLYYDASAVGSPTRKDPVSRAKGVLSKPPSVRLPAVVYRLRRAPNDLLPGIAPQTLPQMCSFYMEHRIDKSVVDHLRKNILAELKAWNRAQRPPRPDTVVDERTLRKLFNLYDRDFYFGLYAQAERDGYTAAGVHRTFHIDFHTRPSNMSGFCRREGNRNAVECHYIINVNRHTLQRNMERLRKDPSGVFYTPLGPQTDILYWLLHVIEHESIHLLEFAGCAYNDAYQPSANFEHPLTFLQMHYNVFHTQMWDDPHWYRGGPLEMRPRRPREVRVGDHVRDAGDKAGPVFYVVETKPRSRVILVRSGCGSGQSLKVKDDYGIDVVETNQTLADGFAVDDKVEFCFENNRYNGVITKRFGKAATVRITDVSSGSGGGGAAEEGGVAQHITVPYGLLSLVPPPEPQ